MKSKSTTQLSQLQPLTTSNAAYASLIIHKTEDWGNKPFSYKSESNGSSSIGRGPNSRILPVTEFADWLIVSYRTAQEEKYLGLSPRI